MEFVVKNISVQDRLTVVALEPLKKDLFLADAIPPGCIQHIISALTKNYESKEECERVCDILYKVPMDDDTSRKTNHSFQRHSFNSTWEKWSGKTIIPPFPPLFPHPTNSKHPNTHIFTFNFPFTSQLTAG